MHYVEVLVSDSTYHGQEALTYSCEAALEVGKIVTVPIRKKEVLGIVAAIVAKPRFNTKSVLQTWELPPLPAHNLKLLQWIREYYPSPYGVITQLFLPANLPKKPLEEAAPSILQPPTLPPLTTDQANALKIINQAGTYVLHGNTGTGKTRVYIELAKRAINKNQSAIILTPEIGLTSQLANSFRQVFGDKVEVIHSQLTETTRNKIWAKLLKQTEPSIIIGPRSALFAPLGDIGLIVVDESHETSYKQDKAPYYHTSRVAAKLAQLNQAQLILGSATPLAADYYTALAKKRPVIKMDMIAAKNDQTNKLITVVDMRDKNNYSKKSFLSNTLIEKIDQTLKNKEQILLFLNRRGTARVILCERCGWQANCPHCDLPLIYHGDNHKVRCHTCDYINAVPSSCGECQNATILFKSIGTKAVAEEMAKLFPAAKIMRFDTDNKKTERIEHNFDSVKNGDVDILVGTQTLAKGLDLPKLALVGIIAADSGLFLPDFSSQERTFQLLSQVIGRVGRGHIKGEVVLQSHNPDTPLLKNIVNDDWFNFYKYEIAERQQYLFPPFCYLLKLSCRRSSEASSQKSAKLLAAKLRATFQKIIVEGPAPAFHQKIQNKYQWQIIVKTKKRENLIGIIKSLPSGWQYDIDPLDLL